MHKTNRIPLIAAALLAVALVPASQAQETQPVEEQTDSRLPRAWQEWRPYEPPAQADTTARSASALTPEAIREAGERPPARFLSVDPHADNYPAWSPYHYAANNPVSITDPDGRDWYQSQESRRYEWYDGSDAREGYDHIGTYHRYEAEGGRWAVLSTTDGRGTWEWAPMISAWEPGLLAQWGENDPILYPALDAVWVGVQVMNPLTNGEERHIDGSGVLGGERLDAMPGFLSAALGGSGVSRAVGAVRAGREPMIGRMRFAPFGNSTGHPIGRWPHYHRGVPDLSRPGNSLPGQGVGRHRPWEVNRTYDRSFWDRF